VKPRTNKAWAALTEDRESWILASASDLLKKGLSYEQLKRRVEFIAARQARALRGKGEMWCTIWTMALRAHREAQGQHTDRPR
jgi:hypothetical protein